jgi:hypothetical protein
VKLCEPLRELAHERQKREEQKVWRYGRKDGLREQTERQEGDRESGEGGEFGVRRREQNSLKEARRTGGKEGIHEPVLVQFPVVFYKPVPVLHTPM